MTTIELYNVTNQYDIELVNNAEKMCWEEIEENKALTNEGRNALHSIMMQKYHRDEYSCGML